MRARNRYLGQDSGFAPAQPFYQVWEDIYILRVLHMHHLHECELPMVDLTYHIA